jgi:hypothetical protein
MHTYADQWVEAAFTKSSTSFQNGNTDFSKYTFVGREQAIKKGTVVLHTFMYAINTCSSVEIAL